MNENESAQNQNDLLRTAKSAPAVTVLTAANILIFLGCSFFGSPEDMEFMINAGASFPPLILRGQFWRLFSCMFLHFSAEHLFSNMLGLFFLGSIIEQELGSFRFLFLYLLSGLSGSLVSMFFSVALSRNTVSAGASGAVFGIIGALVMLRLRKQGKFRGLYPRNLFFMAFYSLFAGFTSTRIDNAAHVGGFLAGMLLCLLV